MADSDDEAPNKQIRVNAASLIDLKAELAKKREQFNRDKLTNAPRVKPQKVEKRNAGVEERNLRDLSESQLDKDELEESRKALEKKALLYDELKASSLKQEEETPFLVDFEQKAINDIIEKKKEAEQEPESDSDFSDLDNEPRDPSEDWVEFVDSLGRTRICLRRDLPHYKKLDDKLKPKPQKEDEFKNLIPQQTSQNIDQHHERLREKWSQNEEDTKRAAHVHYENIRFDEIRDHGIGFFRFSTDEQTRLEERRILDELREKTVQQRRRSQILRQKRKSVMKERLKRVRRRKRIRLGLDPEEEEEEERSDSDVDPLKVPVQEIKLPEPKVEKPIREWDIGKAAFGGPEQMWAKKKEVLRGEREEEFAPPKFIY